MGKKIIIFKISEDSFETGFPFSIRLSDDETRELLVETEGKLPPASNVYQSYLNWQYSYRNLTNSLRLGANQAQVTNIAVDECIGYIHDLQLNLNQWLKDSSVQSVLFDLFPHLEPQDLIRFVIQTADVRLWQLPWYLWDVWQRYPHTEFALSKPNCQKPSRSDKLNHNGKVRILAILGDRRGIDVERDRRILNSLPNAEVVFLDQPNLAELTPLWEQSWQILFFAGHSSTNHNSQSGLLHINPYETIDIQKLKNTLTKAIYNGLELAIFNSCDGLGLGYSLADLQLPQGIIMREPVPDEVAQEFLKFFLQAYANGDTLYQAVKEAKTKIQELHHLEQKAPGSSWLPVIYQNLAVNPPLWSDLTSKSFSPPNFSFLSTLNQLFFPLVAMTGCILLFFLTGLSLFNILPRQQSASPQPVRKAFIGLCECPYDIDIMGRECGNKSAYSRPGGTQPVCYKSDTKK